MKHPLQTIQRDLHQILECLDRGAFFSFTSEEEAALRKEANSLSRKVSAIEGSFLTIGLLGGTGVGKSTLMNALAGSEIASTSHRRPHTDHVLIYRHAEVDALPALALGNVPWREIVHPVDAIRQILLCDLPDFDSLMGEHREHVLQFLEHLDLLIWVTSPEKYADGRFYEFLLQVPKAKQNFTFVLNKLDLLFEGETPEKGYEQMALVVRRFQELIRENGIEDPLSYGIAAEEVLRSDQLAPWNQFHPLRKQVFQQRDVKQISAIKASNLDVEVHQLYSAFEKEARNLESFERILDEAVKDLEGQRSTWVQAGQETIELWLGRQISHGLLSYHRDPAQLVGPGYGLGLLFQEFQKRFAEDSDTGSELLLLNPPEEITLSFRRRLEWVEDRVNHRILRRNLPSAFGKRLQEILDVGKRFDDLGESFFHAVTFHAVDPPLPALWGFRAVQWIAYVLVFAFLLFAMGGESAWQNVLNHPGAGNMLRLFLSLIHTLFSSKGLAALGSYALINLFLGFFFYRRYRKRLLRAAQKRIDNLKVALSKIWEESLDEISGDVKRFKADIQSQRSGLSFMKSRSDFIKEDSTDSEVLGSS